MTVTAPSAAPAPAVHRRTTGLAIGASALVALSTTVSNLVLHGVHSLTLQLSELAIPAAVVVYLVWLAGIRHNTELRAPGTLNSTGYVVAEYFLPVINLWAPARTLLRVGRTATARPVPRTLIIGWAVAWNVRLLSYVPSLVWITPYVNAPGGIRRWGRSRRTGSSRPSAA